MSKTLRPPTSRPRRKKSTVPNATKGSLIPSKSSEEASSAAINATTEEKQLNANRKAFVIATLRRASYRWKGRTEAFRAARVDRGKYKCASCTGLFSNKEVQLDHIDPIVPVRGWDSWDGYIERLFCPGSGYQVCCRSCHASKTLLEKELRKQFRLPKPKKKGTLS